jgi:5'-3' exoribonuclease 1
MGIKFFFTWIQKNFEQNIYALKKGQKFLDIKQGSKQGLKIDNLMLDMNGIFHNSAQKIFGYGSHKKASHILLLENCMGRMSIDERIKNQNLTYKDICETIDNVFNIVKPSKKLILCVDGPAPLAKQNQQRQRRFRSAKESSPEDFNKFDSNCISPGTKFMDFLSKYIDWYIRKKISVEWKDIEVIFSSEKAPGEGEHKLLTYYRFYGDKNESYCVYANDADLIMLALGTHNDNFYILRDCMYDKNYEYYVLNTPGIAENLVKDMRFESENFDPYTAINDFIFISFMIGNDFLPNIPSLEILQNGMEIMFDVYKKIGESYGHITQKTKEGVIFRNEILEKFLGSIAQYEKDILLDKYKKKNMFFEDLLLNKSIKIIDGKYELDFPSYKKDYYSTKFQGGDINDFTQKYLEGLQWVLSYYTNGTPAWRWVYPYNYAPFASEIAENIKLYFGTRYRLETPILPFLQLLTILPPRSSHLIPYPLNKLLYTKNSPMLKFCPKNFKIDLSGKKREWEGLVILPPLDYNEVIKAYESKIKEVDNRELKRNIIGKSFIYSYTETSKYHFSYYGDISDCHATTKIIDI